MKLTYLAVLGALSALGMGPSLVKPFEPALDRPPVERAALGTSVPAASSSYELQVVGERETCSVALHGAPEERSGMLDVGPDCRQLYRELGQARFWLRNGDGDILFLTREGGTVAEFFPGDGVAYESLRPAQPLMILSSL